MDNYSIWEAHDNDCERRRAYRPQCNRCGENIQDDYYFDYCGLKMCEGCFDDEFRKETPDNVLKCEVCGRELDDMSWCVDDEWLCEDCAKDNKERIYED